MKIKRHLIAKALYQATYKTRSMLSYSAAIMLEVALQIYPLMDIIHIINVDIHKQDHHKLWPL